MLGKNIEYDEQKRTDIKNALPRIAEALNDGRISLIEKMKYKKELEMIENISVDGTKLKDDITLEKINVIAEKTNYDSKIAKIKADIISVLPQSNLLKDVNENEFSRSTTYLVDMLSTFNSYSTIVNDLKYALSDIYKDNETVKELIKEEQYEKVYEKIIRAKDYSNYLETENDFNNALEQLEEKTSKDRDVFKGLVNAIREKNVEAFVIEKSKIEKIYAANEGYSKIKNKYKYETLMFPKFISSYISMNEQDRKMVNDNFDEIINYYKINMFFKDKEASNKKLDDLFKEKEMLDNEEKEVIVKTIEENS